MRQLVLASLLVLLFAFSSVPAQGQQNPTPAACELPASGQIVNSVTYTLTADCEQTGQLELLGPPGGQPGITLTIDGAGHTIKLGVGNFAFLQSQDTRNTIELKNVTIDGQFNKRTFIIESKSISAEKVTFTRNYGLLIHAASATLTNVLFDNNRVDAEGFGANGGTLNIESGASVTVTNAVFRYNRNMNIVLHAGGSLITEGCLRFTGNLAYNVVHSGVWASAGSWTDNSDSECSGEIGNGSQAVLPPTQLTPCGLPTDLFIIDGDATFTLRSDCEGVVGFVVSGGKHATIEANGYRISRTESLPAVYRVAGGASLTINDAVFDKGQFLNYGTLTMTHSEVRNSLHLALINYGTASFSNMLFQDNSAPQWAGLYYAGAIFSKGIGTFSDSKFDGVSGGSAVLRGYGSTVVLNLNGCIIFEGLDQYYSETWFDGGATLNDNRDAGACSPTVGPRRPVTIEKPGPAATEPSVQITWPPAEVCAGKPEALPMGAVACVFRHTGELAVYGIDERSRGFFMAAATPAQINAVGAGMVAASPDGRAAIFADENGGCHRLGWPRPRRQGLAPQA